MSFFKKRARNEGVVPDWRTAIPQHVKASGTRSATHRRYSGWARTFIVSVFTLGVIAILAGVWAEMTGDPSDDGFVPLRVEMTTDGVLDEKWFHAWTGVNFDSRDVSIVQLKKKLERYGQVKSAEVKRGRDNLLRVTLRERDAVGRVAAGGKVKMLAGDGVLFPSETFAVAQDKLPFITGMKTEVTEDGLEHGVAIEPLLQFLALVRRSFPEMLLEWREVSVEKLPEEIFDKKLPQPWATIRVKTRPEHMNPAFPPIREIVFSAQNFPDELALWGAQDAQVKLERHFSDDDREKSWCVVFLMNRKNAHRPILETRIIPISEPKRATGTRNRQN